MINKGDRVIINAGDFIGEEAVVLDATTQSRLTLRVLKNSCTIKMSNMDVLPIPNSDLMMYVKCVSKNDRWSEDFTVGKVYKVISYKPDNRCSLPYRVIDERGFLLWVSNKDFVQVEEWEYVD